MSVADHLKTTASILARQYGHERALKRARSDQKAQAKLGNQAGVDGWEEIINHILAEMSPPERERGSETKPEKPVWNKGWARK
jgi:hypothetical protein